MKQSLIKLASKMLGYDIAYAHCDIPCGIYDPHQAIIGALTVIRMNSFITELEGSDHHHDLSRVIATKEEHAELVKHEVRVIWGDFIKPEHREQNADIDKIVHDIMQTASKAKQGHKKEDGEKLLDLVNQFAEIFWNIKEVKTKKVKAPYAPNSEVVYPDL